MKASETRVFKMLSGTKQFVIPLFQRTYSWREEDWETLWNDIIETYEMSDGHQHFLGSIVNKSLPSTPESASPYVVIDGQQRLTTLTLLLAALRDTVRPLEPQLAAKIRDLYLTNAYVSETDTYKVLPTQADRPEYFAVMDGHPSINRASLVRQAYEYFKSKCSHKPPSDDEQPIDLKRLASVITHGIELVSITLDEPDNEYRIFESLNAKGAPLTQADLLRNYFFMNIPVDKQEAVYTDVWLPMQKALGDDLASFLRYEYMKDGKFVPEGDVYQEWKLRLDALKLSDYTEQLERLAHAACFYKRLTNPETEPHPGLAHGLARLNRWGGRTMYPFLLYVYERYDTGCLDGDGMAEIVHMIESFLVRRLFTGVPTNALNKLFLRLSQQLPDGLDLIEATRAALSDPGRRWPHDDEFREAILSYPLYRDSRPGQCKLILEALEVGLTQKDKEALSDYSKLTVEHVMPQTLTDPWRAELGPAAEEVHRRYLHVLGNLTLTGYNPELSNKPFAQKRVRLAESNVAMNKTIAKEVQWSDAQIVERGRQFADLAVQIWPGPASSLRCSQASGNAGNVRGRGSDNDEARAAALDAVWSRIEGDPEKLPAERAWTTLQQIVNELPKDVQDWYTLASGTSTTSGWQYYFFHRDWRRLQKAAKVQAGTHTLWP